MSNPRETPIIVFSNVNFARIFFFQSVKFAKSQGKTLRLGWPYFNFLVTGVAKVVQPPTNRRRHPQTQF